MSRLASISPGLLIPGDEIVCNDSRVTVKEAHSLRMHNNPARNSSSGEIGWCVASTTGHWYYFAPGDLAFISVLDAVCDAPTQDDDR